VSGGGTTERPGKQRVEDDLLAYCHIRFLETRDPTWVARLPMVRSADVLPHSFEEFRKMLK
jgi:hypothetical protein